MNKEAGSIEVKLTFSLYASHCLRAEALQRADILHVLGNRIHHASDRMAFVCEKFDEAIITYEVSYPDNH